MNYNVFVIEIQFAYLALGILTATFIGSVACGVWLFLNQGTAKFYVKDAMKYLKLIMACFVLPVIPFVILPYFILGKDRTNMPMAKITIHVLHIVLVIWLVVVFFMLIRRLVNYYRVCRLCKDNIPIEDEMILQEVDYWKKQLYIRRRVGVYMNANLSSPSILYHWGYKVLLPAYEMTQQEMSMAILHELVHLKHRDILSKDMCFTVNALHGFNPITRWTKDHLVKWAEVLCDITTCEMGKEHFNRQEYYYGILHLMNNVGNEVKNDAMFCLVESKSLLNFRVNMFAESKKEEQKSLKAVFYFMIVVMVLVTGLVFGITINVTNAVFEESLTEVQEQQQVWTRKTTTTEKLFCEEQICYADAIVNKDVEYFLQANEVMLFPLEAAMSDTIQVYTFCEGSCAMGYIKTDGTARYVEGEDALIIDFKMDDEITTLFVKNLTEQEMFVETSCLSIN